MDKLFEVNVYQAAAMLKANVFLRVIPELNQFMEGLKICGLLDIILEYKDLMAPFFTLSTTPG